MFKRIIKTKDVILTRSLDREHCNTQADLNDKVMRGLDRIEGDINTLENYVHKLILQVKAIKEFLGISFEIEKIPDPAYLPEEPKTIDILKAYKNKKK